MKVQQLQVVRKTDYVSNRLDFVMLIGNTNAGFNIFNKNTSSHKAIQVIEDAHIGDVLVLATYKSGRLYTAQFALNMTQLSFAEQLCVYNSWCRKFNEQLEDLHPHVAEEAMIKLWKERIEPYVTSQTQIKAKQQANKKAIERALKENEELETKARDLSEFFTL